MAHASVKKIEDPLPWRMTFIPDGGTEEEEVVLHVQGVLCEKELPPIEKAMK
jgi:hypothetical protein